MALYDWMRKRYWWQHQKPPEEFIEDSEEYGIDTDANSQEDNTEESINEIINDGNNQNIDTMDSNLHTDALNDLNGILGGRKDLDIFLNEDFGNDGYKDALAYSDNSYAETAKKQLLSKLEFKIGNALSWYNNKISDCRSRIAIESTQFDLVKEIECHMEKLVAEKTRIEQIAQDAASNTGIGLMPIESYDRGFKRGKAALTSAIIFGKTIPNA